MGSAIPHRGALGLACSVQSSEDVLLKTLKDTGGRGQKASDEQLQAIGAALDELERDGGTKDPVLSPKILGILRPDF